MTNYCATCDIFDCATATAHGEDLGFILVKVTDIMTGNYREAAALGAADAIALGVTYVTELGAEFFRSEFHTVLSH